MNMHKYFKTGDEIYGYCGGFFGRDHYDDLVCVSVCSKYAVFEDEEGNGTLINKNYFETWIERFPDSVKEWKDPKNSYKNN